MRDMARLAQLIADGTLSYSAKTCGNPQCSKRLLAQEAFNAESRHGLGQICSACSEWETATGTSPVMG